MLAIMLYVLAGIQALGALAAVYQAGKPRGPLTHGTVVWVVVSSAAIVTVLILAAMALH